MPARLGERPAAERSRQSVERGQLGVEVAGVKSVRCLVADREVDRDDALVAGHSYLGRHLPGRDDREQQFDHGHDRGRFVRLDRNRPVVGFYLGGLTQHERRLLPQRFGEIDLSQKDLRTCFRQSAQGRGGRSDRPQDLLEPTAQIGGRRAAGKLER
jgi:hypothetical protein